MKAHLFILCILLLIVNCARAATITLMASAEVQAPRPLTEPPTPAVTNLLKNSLTLNLRSNQVARVKHFYSFRNARGQILPSTSIGLRVQFEDLIVIYTYQTLYGGPQYASPSGGPGSVFHLAGAAIMGSLPEVVGPATIQLVYRGTDDDWEADIESFSNPIGFDGGAICTIDVDGTADVVGSVVSKIQAEGDSIVVPEGHGPVEIALESSADLKQTWERALPGTYGAATQKRFFRIKAELR